MENWNKPWTGNKNAFFSSNVFTVYETKDVKKKYGILIEPGKLKPIANKKNKYSYKTSIYNIEVTMEEIKKDIRYNIVISISSLEVSKKTENSDNPKVDVKQEEIKKDIIKIIKRKEWGAENPKKDLEEDSNYSNITIHHSGNSGICDIKEIQKEEMDRGFDDIGYHFAINKEGKIYEARLLKYKGSHVLNNNTGRIGILIMGDFEPQNNKSFKDLIDFSWDETTKQQLISLKKLIIYLKSEYPTIKTLGGHMDYKKDTQCPGEILYKKLDNIRKECNLQGP